MLIHVGRKMAFYAVAKGRTPGVYNTWDQAKKQVDGFKYPKFRKFDSREEAEAFVNSAKPTNIVQQLSAQVDAPSESRTGLVVFTDGSAIGNGKANAKAGYAMVWPNHPHLTASFPLEGAIKTNNRAEFMACIKALEAVDVEDPDCDQPLHIYTDSELLINSVTKWMKSWKKNGWKKSSGDPILNADLVQRLDVLTGGKRKIVWTHVEAHTGRTDWMSKWNDVVDKMAREAAK